MQKGKALPLGVKDLRTHTDQLIPVQDSTQLPLGVQERPILGPFLGYENPQKLRLLI